VHYRLQAVFSLTGWSRQIHAAFHVRRATREIHKRPSAFAYGAITHYGPAFQLCFASLGFVTLCQSGRTGCGSHNTRHTTAAALACVRFRLIPVRSPLLGESRLFSFLPATKMFQFAGLPPGPYEFRYRSRDMTLEGLPHSDICGSRLVCSSPQLFAAYHVLLRPLAPRHSPCALGSFTYL
jgi:hypothetical protein